jgi:hypothetical protein
MNETLVTIKTPDGCKVITGRAAVLVLLILRDSGKINDIGFGTARYAWKPGQVVASLTENYEPIKTEE